MSFRLLGPLLFLAFRGSSKSAQAAKPADGGQAQPPQSSQQAQANGRARTATPLVSFARLSTLGAPRLARAFALTLGNWGCPDAAKSHLALAVPSLGASAESVVRWLFQARKAAVCFCIRTCTPVASASGRDTWIRAQIDDIPWLPACGPTQTKRLVSLALSVLAELSADPSCAALVAVSTRIVNQATDPSGWTCCQGQADRVADAGAWPRTLSSQCCICCCCDLLRCTSHSELIPR